MIAENSNSIALVAQADIHRFLIRIIDPSLREFTPGPDLPGGEFDKMDDFLEGARAATHNALCYEMRRAFGLLIGAMFERQLRLWLASGAPEKRGKVECAMLPELETLIEELRGITFQSIGVATDVRELWSVANAVRHGEGRSMKKLATQNPSLWDHLAADTLKNEPIGLVGGMRVKDADLQRYARAVMRFWAAAGASSVPGIL